MKMTLRSLLAVAALGVAALPMISHAEDAPATPPPPMKKGGGRGQMTPEARLAAIDTAVTLTADEKTKVMAILTKQTSDMAALDPADRRTKGMEIATQANKDIRALLTPDQQTKFDAMPAPQMGRGGKKGGN
jgi:protein CpxP